MLLQQLLGNLPCSARTRFTSVTRCISCQRHRDRVKIVPKTINVVFNTQNKNGWFCTTSISERLTQNHVTSSWIARTYSDASKSEESAHKKDNIATIPNLLCVSRIVVAPYLAHLIIEGNFTWAAGLFMFAGATDFLDGWIARKFKGQSSRFGSFLDPLADKILVGSLFLSLTYVNMIPASLTGLIVSRDIFLIYAGLYIRYMSVVPPFTLKKYFDISLGTAQVLVPTISKINTGLQFSLLALTLGSPLLGYMNHPWLHYMWAATGATTFLSAVSYAFKKDTYKFSHREYDHQFGKKLTAFILFVMFNIGFTVFFPSQPQSNKTSTAECPITGVGGTSADCPISGEDKFSESSLNYYKKKALESRDRREDEPAVN